LIASCSPLSLSTMLKPGASGPEVLGHARPIA
jgi:hypothetical protein